MYMEYHSTYSDLSFFNFLNQQIVIFGVLVLNFFC